jgi:hypothetical protein
MKGLKLSKASWLILSAGVFLVVLAGLGLTRSQQMKEQSKLGDELSQYEKRLATMQTTQLTQQLENLSGKIDESQSLLKNAKARLDQTVISVDVADEFFKVAAYCSVNITNLSTTLIAQTNYAGIPISTISLSATVVGEKKNIINFIDTVNNDYITGNINSAAITFQRLPGAQPPEEDTPPTGEGDTLESGLAQASVNMLIYSCEGK